MTASPSTAPPGAVATAPTAATTGSPVGRFLLAGCIAAGLAVFANRLPGLAERGGDLALSLTFGALLGIVLQRSRFCFFCAIREMIDERNPQGLLGLLAALAVGLAGYTLIFGAWVPNPASGRLAPTAHIGPVGPVLVLAGLAFGAGMSVSGSCISAHLYRLGEGSPTAPFALAGTALGFGLGFLAWNPLYLAAVAEAPVVWLPRHLGYGGALTLALALIAALALWLVHTGRNPEPTNAASPLEAVFVRRWPAWAGGLAVGAIGTAAYFRLAPLGVTAEIGSRTRQAAAGLGWLPDRLYGLDQLRGCATLVRDTLFTPNGLFVVALVLGSFATALVAGQFRPAWPTASQVLRGLVGGALMGFGAMIGLGCTIGTLLSGIMAGALSGWIFAAAMLAGLWATLVLGRRLGLLPR
jgi:uncharacterized membrane protein YedE/YeeE